ncbi:hypothetical protein RM572_21700 [Streptomyces sp. DSM 42041]|uniref:DUF1059 domain-containing protein n=1 Tax=Streptomyces hazeniae TaxID=3075538 RepID=A0ABU2NWK2_9ACTN|nr:hypothetical protein [Streptomyces sp. DSM 42041]MDT0381376.1 hypothetical protein [Streptomyces sp. DSM 42041]
MSTAYYHCPVGAACTYSEPFDPTHETDDPSIPASSDEAHDRLVEHVMTAHGVPENEVGALVSQARRDTSKPAIPGHLLREWVIV